MNYFIDFEFSEGFHTPVFGKRRHFIDMISVGIVCEDGREYSAISSEYNYKESSPWVRENVLVPLYVQTVHGDQRLLHDVHNFHKAYGKPNKQIAQEIFRFINPIMGELFDPLPVDVEYMSKHNCMEFQDGIGGRYVRAQPDFYGYYCDYDWVLFCSLFGTMMELPEGFPMYCRDLKQMLDNRVRNQTARASRNIKDKLDATLRQMQAHPRYPKQENQHSAIADAKWNHELFKFLTT